MVTMFQRLILKRDFKKRHTLYELIGLNISHYGSLNNKVNAYRSKSCISSHHMNLLTELTVNHLKFLTKRPHEYYE